MNNCPIAYSQSETIFTKKKIGLQITNFGCSVVAVPREESKKEEEISNGKQQQQQQRDAQMVTFYE